jgi:diguanylate cyclase (GGDEF)-like protein
VSARAVTAWYIAGTAGLMLAVPAIPALGAYGQAVPALGAVIAIAVGVLRNRPRPPWPWWLLAVAVAGSAAAPALPAGLGYLTWLAAAGVALHQLTRSGSVRGNWAGLVDASTVTLAALLALWAGLISPALPLSHVDHPIRLGYPIGDVLLLGLTASLVVSRHRRRSVELLAAGLLAAFAADVTASLTGHATPYGWLLLYAAWGAAGLHPSMARLTEPEALAETEITVRRLSAVVLTSLVAPTILLVEALAGPVRDAVVIAVVGGTIGLLNVGSLAVAADADRRLLIYRHNHDTLTGLANRTLFAERLAARLAEPDPVAIVLVNLDGFTLVNESMGHSAGDEVLRTVARRLTRILGGHDLAARLGNDDFAILAAPAPADLDQFATRLAEVLDEPIPFAGHTIRITAGMGLASTLDTGTAEDLLTRANLALQAARSTGPAQWCRYRSEVHGPMVERLRLRAALARAAAEDSFTVRYQPIVVIETGLAVGFEALIRWEHPTRGVIAPSEFIELAEETGLIEKIGDLVLRRAVTAAAHWHRTAPSRPYVSVNVSALQLRGFAEKVDRELAAAGLAPEHLMVELTESVLLREEDDVWAELAALRDTGVRLAIDDFGTGFSSLSYLLQTPIEVIKIDKSFVANLVGSARHQVLVDGIVRLAEELGLQVVAEGIETAAVRDALAEMGCPYGQGFLYAAPLAGGDVARWLAGLPVLGDPTVPSEYAHSGATPAPPGTLLA